MEFKIIFCACRSFGFWYNFILKDSVGFVTQTGADTPPLNKFFSKG